MRPLTLITALVAFVAPLLAQPRWPDLQVGLRVRVHATQGTSEGAVLASAPDSLVLADVGTGARRAMAAADVRRVERYVGREGHIIRGMGYGFVAGAVAGAVIGAIGWRPCNDAEWARNPSYCRRTSREDDMVEGASIVGVAIGIPVGGIVGAFVKTDTWADIPFKPVIAALRRD